MKKSTARRMAFVPNFYRDPVVLGWMTESGFLPDSPCEGPGEYLPVEICSDTPTIPPEAVAPPLASPVPRV